MHTHRPGLCAQPLALGAVTALDALLALSGLLVVTLLAGLTLRWRQGRVRRVSSDELVQPERLGADGLGESATLLQFSTEMCSRCPGVHRMLSTVAAERDGVRHLDVDLTHRPDIAKHFHVLQTPTTLILDRRGAVQSRIGGVPGRDMLELELDRLTGETADV
jgi:thiol-disulfide isomerase/thioredoxin